MVCASRRAPPASPRAQRRSTHQGEISESESDTSNRMIEQHSTKQVENKQNILLKELIRGIYGAAQHFCVVVDNLAMYMVTPKE